MATIKGENLRVLVGEDEEDLMCIAASTACTMHCALQVEEDTTKDTVDDWIEREPVGLNWDVQVDALIISDDDEEYLPGAHAYRPASGRSRLHATIQPYCRCCRRKRTVTPWMTPYK